MSKPELDCTRKCKSKKHGQQITSAITKRSASDKALASFIKGTCAKFSQAQDFEGRTALHMAASRGREALVEWLMRHSSENLINARDGESGYTPLHRSIFYGQIHTAVALMKMGVNTDVVDKDDYKALEHAMLDRHYMYKHEGTQPCDVYVWGSNSNFTLGTGTQQQRNTPELLSFFSRTNSSVRQVCLGKFHSIWLCGEEGAWCAGQAGRIGAARGTQVRPLLLRLPEPARAAAVTLESTIFLLNTGLVLQYTLKNTELSQTNSSTSAVKLPYVKPLCKMPDAIGLCSSRNHAVVWNSTGVYTWGVNLGQLGHSQDEKIVLAPKQVSISLNKKEEACIELVSAGEAATVITTSRGDVYLVHKHLCKKIAVKQINLHQVCVESKVSEQGVYSRVTVLLLTNVGQLLLWQDTSNRLTRCVFGLNHQVLITHVALTHDAIYFTTKYGEAFVGYISRKSTPPPQSQPIKKEKAEREKDGKSALVKFLERDDCSPVRISKIPNIHRAVSIAVDNEGLNFACLQIKPNCGSTSLPELSPTSLSKHMETLMETASDDDLLHDVIFKVGKKSFPAHILIVASSSEHLYKLYQEKLTQTDEKPIVNLDNVHPDVFERILRFMYTGTCDVMELGPCYLKVKREDLIADKKEKDSNIEAELDIIENPAEISAFEVHKMQNNKKNKGRSKRVIDTPPRQYLYCDPVKLVQSTAKKLQVMALHKLLDKYYYRDGTICVKESATHSRGTPPMCDRDSRPELVDTRVRAKEGELIPAHKCILAARLDYFRGMFLHSWTESKTLSIVTLPINHAILLPVINFLYTDSCPDLETTDSIDFICSVMIVADQLIITRLREMCEIALANLITLRNCTELCQIAHTYNATQLKHRCMEFISLNICSLLENRALELLENPLLEDITSYYCKFNPIMSSRIITPFYNAPSDDVIEDFEKNYPVDLHVTDEDCKKDESVTEISRRKRRDSKNEYTANEKARMRYESVSLVNTDLSNETTGDITLTLSKIPKEQAKPTQANKWIEVTSPQQKQQKDVQARLKAISKAKDILNETPTESFTKLTRNNSFSTITSPSRDNSFPTSSRMSVSPKESPIMEMMTGGSLVINHVGPKLSQKQRKKLAMTAQDSGQNLSEFLDNKLTLNSPPQPKNPWKVCEVPVASSSPKDRKSLEFNQILADQKKQKGDFSRIMSKPLHLTQLEDKAIEELERFYNIHGVDDEFITVRRIELQVATPQWLHHAPK